MKHFPFCIIFSVLLIARLSAQERFQLTFVPDKQFIPSFTASGTEHRISYAKQFSSPSYRAALGGSFPMLHVRWTEFECLVNVSGTVYTTLESAGIKYQVTNADYYADVSFDIPLSDQTVLRLGSGHTSHHLVDDAVIALGNARVINYARDYFQMFVVHTVPQIRGFVYGGTYYNHSFLANVRRDGQFLLQCGADGGNYSLYGPISLYAAVDLKLRSEAAYASTQSYQIGIRAQGNPFRAVRLAYTYRTGMDDRGQFYTQRNRYHSAGIYFDF